MMLLAQKLCLSMLHLLLGFGGVAGTLSLYTGILILFLTTLFQFSLLPVQEWVVLSSPAVLPGGRLILQAPTQPAERCHELLGLYPDPSTWYLISFMLQVIVLPELGRKAPGGPVWVTSCCGCRRSGTGIAAGWDLWRLCSSFCHFYQCIWGRKKKSR